jgi:hypothetical protein
VAIHQENSYFVLMKIHSSGLETLTNLVNSIVVQTMISTLTNMTWEFSAINTSLSSLGKEEEQLTTKNTLVKETMRMVGQLMDL